MGAANASSLPLCISSSVKANPTGVPSLMTLSVKTNPCPTEAAICLLITSFNPLIP
jgi:predicted secreted protein